MTITEGVYPRPVVKHQKHSVCASAYLWQGVLGRGFVWGTSLVRGHLHFFEVTLMVSKWGNLKNVFSPSLPFEQGPSKDTSQNHLLQKGDL